MSGWVAARVRLVVLMARPALVLLLGSYACIGLAQHGNAQRLWLVAGALVVVVGYLLVSVVLNDLADAEVDRINLPGDRRRPLASGSAPADLVVVAVVGGVLALGAAAALGWRVLAVLLVGLLVGAAYSLPPLRLSKRGAVASLLLPLNVVGVPYLVGLLAGGGDVRRTDLVLLGGLYAAVIGRLLLKDFRDVRGDALLGKRTFLVRHGRVVTCRVSAALSVLGGGLLMAAVPDRTPALVGLYVVGLAAVVALLRRLSRTTSPRDDTVLVGAIAVVGRGLVAGLLAHLAMRPLGWTAWQQALTLLALGVLTAGLASDLLRHGPQVRGTAPAAPAEADEADESDEAARRTTR
ncbi:UbiA family prenyltransferase [Angustibacter luteus]|uniref:UbiA family prenyltransferase n=1 Tax=Angustibacter luteus TaxID=658456 RepID=A0ABW1JFF1_9ACTN